MPAVKLLDQVREQLLPVTIDFGKHTQDEHGIDTALT
jgi:hypothetical protein